MKIEDYFDKNEKPLDRLLPDAGLCGIFRTIACIGDSLSSGEFVIDDENGNRHWYDMFEYSWGQYIARAAGSQVYNFSKGGMSAREYISNFADKMGYWDRAKAAQAYIIALGVNDLRVWRGGGNEHISIGTADDRDTDAETFARYYCEIIDKYKKIQPDAKFFLMTMVRCGDSEVDAKVDAHAKLLHDIADMDSNCYVIDFNKYGPVYDTEFEKKFYMCGHLTPAGYVLTAKMVMSYIDYIIRHNIRDFDLVGLIGKYPELKELEKCRNMTL